MIGLLNGRGYEDEYCSCEVSIRRADDWAFELTFRIEVPIYCWTGFNPPGG